MTTLALTNHLSLRSWAPATGTGSGTWIDFEDLRGTTGEATAVRPLVVSPLPGFARAFGQFARAWFVSMDPSWPVRSAHLYELSLVFEPGTGTATAVRARVSPLRATRGLASPAVMLAEIRSIVGLNIAETARVIGVERPTIYAWLSDRSTPQRANSLRLVRIADLAARWRRRSEMPLGDRARLAGPDGRSIVDLMALDPIPDALIEERLAVAATNELGWAPGTRRGVPGIRELAIQHGIAVNTRPGSQTEIDWLTRRSLGAEDS